jgi:hypothetical protein
MNVRDSKAFAFPFWESRLLPSRFVRAIEIGGQLALFDERMQRLSDLNETAAVIWRNLSDGRTCADIGRHLQNLGATSEDAAAFTTSAVTEWLQGGYVTPVEAVAALARQPSATQALRIGPLSLELRCFGTAHPDAVAAVFGQFASEETDAHATIAVVACASCDFLFLDDAPIGMNLPHQTVPALKGLVTEEYCHAVREGFVAHGGLVSSNGRGVFLSGEPGAGKSTLALALCARGFAYGSDDIVHIGADGAASGIPFAAAAKSTAWELLDPYLPHLASLPIYERADAQLTRYVLPERLDREGPRPMDIVLLLARKAGAEAKLEPLAPLQSLCALLDSGYSRRNALDAATLEALARNLSRAKSYRLIYDGLSGAIATIESLIGE